MTKEQAAEIKRQLKSLGKYSTYFTSKTGELSVRVYTYINDDYDPAKQTECIEKVLNDIKTDAEWIVKQRTYQGFIHDTCIIYK